MGLDDFKVYKAFFIRELFTDVGGIGISDGLGGKIHSSWWDTYGDLSE